MRRTNSAYREGRAKRRVSRDIVQLGKRCPSQEKIRGRLSPISRERATKKSTKYHTFQLHAPAKRDRKHSGDSFQISRKAKTRVHRGTARSARCAERNRSRNKNANASRRASASKNKKAHRRQKKIDEDLGGVRWRVGKTRKGNQRERGRRRCLHRQHVTTPKALDRESASTARRYARSYHRRVDEERDRKNAKGKRAPASYQRRRDKGGRAHQGRPAEVKSSPAAPHVHESIEPKTT